MTLHPAERPPFPSVVDSTIIAAIRSCQRRAAWTYLDHWKPQRESVDLVAGKAFASGLEAARNAFYRDGKPPAEALHLGFLALTREYGDFQAPEGHAKTWLRVAGALEYYFSVYPLGGDRATPRFFGDRHGIEFSFAIPLPVKHPETGDPIIFCGRADMVADAFGGLMIFDEKTTTQLGPKWAEQWEMRSQFTAYSYGLKDHGINPTGIVVRGIAIRQDGYDNQQHITYRSDYERERWLWQTCRDLNRFIEAWRTGEYDYNLDTSCMDYRRACHFTRACKSPEPQKWIEIEFTKRVWNPLTRSEHG